jgi:hypothetical protein
MEQRPQLRCVALSTHVDGHDEASLLKQVDVQRAILAQLSRNQPVPSTLIEELAAGTTSKVGGQVSSLMSLHYVI